MKDDAEQSSRQLHRPDGAGTCLAAAFPTLKRGANHCASGAPGKATLALIEMLHAFALGRIGVTTSHR